MTRAFVSGMRVHLKQFSRNPFDVSGVVLWPILYASIAYYLLDAKEDPELLLSASLGAAVMLMWSLVVIGSAGALEQQRWLGTLELLVAAPVPFAAVIAPISVASGAVGAYSLVATLAWGTLFFDVPLAIEQPLAFAVAIPACVLAIGMLGLVMAATFVLYRAAFSLGIAMQYPVWIATGLLVPLSVLPAFVGPISWFLAPTWGFRAIQEAALGGTPWADIGMCLVVSAAYFVVGSALPARVRAGREGARDAQADMNWLRVFFVGGLTSYRALFNWISPWVFVPHMIGYPVFEILFFAYLGRYAEVESDEFFLIGNAFIAIAVTGLFGMSAAIAGERRSQTLSALLASPANRLALFLGRALPSIVTGWSSPRSRSRSAR